MAEKVAPTPPVDAKPAATEKPKPASAESADQQVTESLRDTWIGGFLGKEEPKAEAVATPEAEGKAKPAAKPTVKGAAPTPSPEPEKEKETPEPAPAPKKKTKVEISRAPAPQPQPQPSVDVAQIANAAAAAAVQANRQMQQEQEDKRTESEIPPEVRKNAEVYSELHKANPSKYPKDLTQRMARFVTAERQRAEDWQKSHPGESYDSDADEHAAWYSANQPDIDPEDFTDARISVKVEKRAREIVQSEVAPKTAHIERQMEQQRLEPILAAQTKTLGEPILKAILPDFEGEITSASMGKLMESDPVAVEVAADVDNSYARVVYDAGLLWHGAIDYDERNQAHSASRNILIQFEQELASVRPSELVRNGKRWCPLAEFGKLPLAQRAAYYTVEYPDFVKYVRDHVAPTQAKRIYEEKSTHEKDLIEKRASRYGWKKHDATETAHSNGSSNGGAAHVAASPVVTPGTPPSPAGQAAATAPTDPSQEFWKGLLGR